MCINKVDAMTTAAQQFNRRVHVNTVKSRARHRKELGGGEKKQPDPRQGPIMHYDL